MPAPAPNARRRHARAGPGFAVVAFSAKVIRVPERSGTKSPGEIRSERGCSAVGSASPCQGEGREFESRHPLECGDLLSKITPWGNHTWWRGRAARHRPAKPFTRVRIPSPPPHSRSQPDSTWAIGAAVARFPDTEEVTGSIPVSRTAHSPRPGRGLVRFPGCSPGRRMLAPWHSSY